MPETDHDEDGKSDVNYGEKCHENYEKSDGKTLPELKKDDCITFPPVRA